MALSPGTTLGPYAIVSQLGSGGMGIVYRAHDPRLDRHVAIKLLPPDLTRDETAKQRFLQEAQAASALDHPNICSIFEINETADGQLYLVMAHYDGETLKERISRGLLGREMISGSRRGMSFYGPESETAAGSLTARKSIPAVHRRAVAI